MHFRTFGSLTVMNANRHAGNDFGQIQPWHFTWQPYGNETPYVADPKSGRPDAIGGFPAIGRPGSSWEEAETT